VSAQVQRTGPADGVTVLTITHPEVRNALARRSWIELRQAAQDMAADPRVRAVVLTGGESCFSAGGDIKAMTSSGTGVRAPVERLSAARLAVRSLHALPQPLIAAVEGYTAGAGLRLALTCDLVGVARNVFFQASFLDRPLVADGELAGIMARQLGRVKTTNLLLTRQAGRGRAGRAAQPREPRGRTGPGGRDGGEPGNRDRRTPVRRGAAHQAARPLGRGLDRRAARGRSGEPGPGLVQPGRRRARQAFLERRRPRFNLDLATEQ
jgi:hypothetical protein